MPLEPHKILPVVSVLATVRTSDNIAALAALAAANSELRLLCLPYLFSHVRWPHPNKHDEESGLHFFPETLWPLFKRFDLIWPDDWPDASPPRWGDRYYVGGDYHPRHTDKLATALPRMPALVSFSICCPFFPPNSLFNALLTCTSVRELRMTDTPLYISMIPKSPPEFVIERLYLIPVAEAPRVGQSPYHSRYSSPDLYYSREYRKKYKNDILARYAASAFLFDVGKPTSLTQVQVSGDLCTLDEFYQHEWPRLVSLVMTGHPPRQTGTELVDVISKMRELKELRLLFAKSVTRGDAMFKVLPAAPEYTSAKGNHGSLLEQIESLAVSDACNLDRVGYFLKGVERLAILAISDIAEPTSAFSKRAMQKILREVSAAGTPAPRTIPPKRQRQSEKKKENADADPELVSKQPETVYKNQVLKHLRIMLEEKIEPDICNFLANRFPNLEVLEVEKCGYHDGRDVPTWSEYIESLKPIRRTLKNLRLGMQFESLGPLLDYPSSSNSKYNCSIINDDVDHTPKAAHAWRIQRQNCAQYFAAKLGQLTRVGFEYRRRPGPHRFDDRWLDWDIDRRRFTPQMIKEWEIRREAKLARVEEERRVRAEEIKRKMEEERKVLLERFRKEEQERREREERERREREERETKDREEREEREKKEREREEREKKHREERRRKAREAREAREQKWKEGQEESAADEDADEKVDEKRHEASMIRSLSLRKKRTSAIRIPAGGSTNTTPPASTSSLTTPLAHASSTPNLFQTAHNFPTTYTIPGGPTTSYSAYPPYTTYPNSSSPLSTPTYPPPNQESNLHMDYFSMNHLPQTYYMEEQGTDWDSDDEDPEGILGVYELRPSWYPFPEVWKPRTLFEEEEIADTGGDGGDTSSSRPYASRPPPNTTLF